MSWKAVFCAATAAVMLSTAADARRFGELDTRSLGGRTFEVYHRVGASPVRIWCTAGRYAELRLRQYSGRLYLTRGKGPSETRPGRQSYIFSLDKPARTSTGITLSVTRAGFNTSIGNATFKCQNLEIRDRDN